MSVAYINIGSNMGNRKAFIELAVAHIEQLCGTKALRSDYFESQPWGYKSDATFLNLGIAVENPYSELELLLGLQDIERGISCAPHRDESGGYIDRCLDIDIIAIDSLVVDVPGLTLPHPRMHLRDFVLVPMMQIAPGWKHPIFGLTPGQMLEKL